MLIEKSSFGSIVVNGEKYKKDIYIMSDGSVELRKKELSKPISRRHTVLGPKEIGYLLSKNPNIIVIGKGQRGILPIPAESRELLKKSGVIVIEDKTSIVFHLLNNLIKENANVVAVLHITC